jgi:hypothetical protein
MGLICPSQAHVVASLDASVMISQNYVLAILCVSYIVSIAFVE